MFVQNFVSFSMNFMMFVIITVVFKMTFTVLIVFSVFIPQTSTLFKAGFSYRAVSVFLYRYCTIDRPFCGRCLTQFQITPEKY